MKALALFSGGLDSMLAMKLITAQGIKVTALHMNIGFGGKSDRSEILRARTGEVGADFMVVDVRNPYLQKVLLNPKFGYGKHFNPCIDCHAYMFRVALDMLESSGAKFIITGEVLGQRPMSQRKEALNAVLKLSGDEEKLILRPMSAKLLEPTTPEIEGWVDREKLLDISGRGRERQLKMAEEFGFSDYDTPGGGCLLTIDSFSKKLKDALKFEGLDAPNDTEILKFGRHLRLENGAKLIIGKDALDNENLKKIENEKFSEISLPDGVVGPFALLSNGADESDTLMALRLVLTYSKHGGVGGEMRVFGKSFEVKPFESKGVASEYFVG